MCQCSDIILFANSKHHITVIGGAYFFTIIGVLTLCTNLNQPNIKEPKPKP